MTSGGADLGAADPQLVAALAGGDAGAIVAALQNARLLVGVIAMPGAEHASEGEMALALLESADGERALPAFTGLDAMTAWNPQARPVPRAATEIFAYAQAESLAAVVIDPGAPHSQILWTGPETPPAGEPDPPPAPRRRWGLRRRS